MRINVKFALFETSRTNFSVRVVPSPESLLKNKLWLLKATPCGLFNADTKYEPHFDTWFNVPRLHPSIGIPQLIPETVSEEGIVPIVMELLDEIMMTGAN